MWTSKGDIFLSLMVIAEYMYTCTLYLYLVMEGGGGGQNQLPPPSPGSEKTKKPCLDRVNKIEKYLFLRSNAHLRISM